MCILEYGICEYLGLTQASCQALGGTAKCDSEQTGHVTPATYQYGASGWACWSLRLGYISKGVVRVQISAGAVIIP
jgi:hypothetical protein